MIRRGFRAGLEIQGSSFEAAVTTATMLKSCRLGVAVVRDRGIHPDHPSVGLGKIARHQSPSARLHSRSIWNSS